MRISPDEAPVRGDIRQLTGLRGVAALNVALTHYGLNALPGGRLVAFGNSAVDLFFCLSSFTLCLVYGAGLPGRLRIGPYAVARVARVYPLFIVSTLFVLVSNLDWQVASFTQTPDRALAVQFVRQASLLSEVPLPFLGPMGCWNNAAWSISVEACCYVLAFPALFALSVPARRLPAGGIVLLTLLTSAVCFVVFVKHFNPNVNGPFFPQPRHNISLFVPLIRGFAMFAAGWLAYLLYRQHRAVAEVFGLLTDALALMFLGIVAAEGYGLLASAAVVMVAPFLVLGLMHGGSVTARILASPPIHFLGVISYSLYLWHLPIRMLAMRLWPWGQVGVSLGHSMVYPLALSLAVAVASFFCFEMPMRRAIKRLAGRPHVAPPVLAV